MISREQFELVRPLLDNAKKRTRPRTHDLFDVLNLILYREHHKLPWRCLPPGSPPWRTLHEYHRMWTMPSRDGGDPLLVQVRAKLAEVQP